MRAKVRQWRKPACDSGKAAYRTQGDALRAIEHIRIENAQAAVPMTFEPRSAYQCGCGAWHITKQRGGVKVGS